MKKKSGKWLKVLTICVFVFAFCGLFVYGCSKAVGYLSSTLKAVKQVVTKMNDVDPDTLFTIKCSKYEDVYASLRPDHPDFFASSGDIAASPVLNTSLALSYADWGAMLNNVLHQKENLAKLESFSVNSNKIDSVIKISMDTNSEEYEELGILGLKQIYLVSTCTYTFDAGRIVLNNSSFTFGGLEKEGEDMQLILSYLGEMVNTLERIGKDTLAESIQVFLTHNTLQFGGNVILTPKESV